MGRSGVRRRSVLPGNPPRQADVGKTILRLGLGAFIQTRRGVPPAKAIVGALSGLFDEAVEHRKRQRKEDGKVITVPYEVVHEKPTKK